MDHEEKSDSDTLKRKHFAKLHERIQTKYNAMKLKLDKSKSIDSLISLNDEFVYKNEMHVSGNSITDLSEEIKLYETVIEEDVKIADAILTEITLDEASTFERGTVYVPEVDKIENEIIFFNNNFRMSLESLNESDQKLLEEYPSESPIQTPSPKNYIRSKISSRLSAAKEKRKEEKEKKTNKKKTPREKVEKYLLTNTTKYDSIKRERKVKTGTVTIALIDATIPDSESLTGERICCRIKLGNAKWKSKSIKRNSPNVSWHELCNFNMYDDPVLDISLWDKDFFLCRTLLDITEVKIEKTHKVKLNLVDGAAPAQVFILLTISGTAFNKTLVDFEDYELAKERLNAVSKKFAWYRLHDDFSEVGWLSVIVYGAKGLSANECYCVLELDNERLHTHTEYKTTDPNWMKIFNFTVTDVTSILRFKIWDEKRSEDIAKLSIPLLQIRNGNKKWYTLKDAELRDRAKGHNPKILLEMSLSWNLVKACVRVINPKENILLKNEAELDRKLLMRNWSRAKAVINWVLYAIRTVKNCFEWESRKFNSTALTLWLLFCYFFKIWMLPLLLLIPFVWYRPPKYFLVNWKDKLFKSDTISEEQDEKEEKTSLRQKIHYIQENLQTCQNYVGKLASLGESIKNLFNFTIPFLTCFAILIIIMISSVMYIIPTNYIFMIWGIHKFTRKILRPNRVPNNEILDLLSRVPDDDTLLDCEELPIDQIDEVDEVINK